MIRIAPLSLLPFLAACMTQQQQPAAETPAPGTQCDANAAMALVGKPADTAAVEAQRLSGARTVRRYRSGDPVTMDFRADRLNVETDAAGTIVKLSCG
jgi:hypothetical protein